MKWTKPRSIWQWMVLFTPALELMFIPFVAERWEAFLFGPLELPGITLSLCNLVVALALSMALGLWLAWECPRWPERIATGLALGAAIAVVNGTIAFAGCAAFTPVF